MRQNTTRHQTPCAGEVGFEPDEYDSRPAFEERMRRAAKRRVKWSVQRVVLAVLGILGTISSLRAARRRPLRAGDPRIRRILVVRTDLIGDLVLTLPAIRALRRAYPSAEVDVLALPSSAPVLAGDPDIAAVITYDPNVWRNPASLLSLRRWREAGALVATLRAREYDLCLSIAGDWASVLAWLSGARRRVGFAREAYPGLMTDPVPGGRYHVRQHEVRYIWALARAAGGMPRANEFPSLSVHAPAAASLAATLARMEISLRPPVIALHASARNGKAKCWPSESWAELADLLVTRLGATVLLTGAAGERAIAHHIAGAARATVHDLTGKTTLPELVALLAHCDLVISGDSGPMHIACAVNTPVIGLFGPTDPGISGPLAPDAVVMRHAIWCAPCYDASATADCRFHNPVCMKAISARSVYMAARRQLARATLPVRRSEQSEDEEDAVATSRTRRLPSL